jgi:hypothetical protein
MRLSTVSVDNSARLWIKIVAIEEYRQLAMFDRRDACG